MRAVVSRVKEAKVIADGVEAGGIERGILILLGIAQEDGQSAADYLAEKCCGLRIFEDQAGKMNLSASEVGGGVLVVSNFTLCGDCRKGKRPSYSAAARPEKAKPLYDYFVNRCRDTGLPVQTGVFGADMQIHQVCDGPVTLVVDSLAAEGVDEN